MDVWEDNIERWRFMLKDAATGAKRHWIMVAKFHPKDILVKKAFNCGVTIPWTTKDKQRLEGDKGHE